MIDDVQYWEAAVLTTTTTATFLSPFIRRQFQLLGVLFQYLRLLDIGISGTHHLCFIFSFGIIRARLLACDY
jgi:hypothetical protein